jgi:hypothetical protein
MPLYVLDTNIFIQAHRVSYPLDVAKSFWNLIHTLASDGKIITIDKVKAEIDNNDDELSEWIDSNLPEEFFKPSDTEKVLAEYALMAPWAESRSDHYQRGAIDEFLDFDNADAWLVSYCKATGDTLVTQETSNPGRKNRIPIPQACQHFDVNYCNMIEMFRSLRVQF